MVCKYCGNDNPNDVTYCSKCGKRIDGKKICPICNKEIPEESIYCTYCGSRVDGKTVCKNCGKVYEGSFCPDCGSITTKQKTNSYKLNSSFSYDYKSILKILKPSFFMASLLVLFICSFFVGISTRANISLDDFQEGTSAISGSSNQSTSFFFLITQFKNIASQLKLATNIYPEYKTALYLPAIINAVIVGANIIICSTYFVLGLLKFINGIQNKQEISLFKYILVPLTSTLFTLCFIYGYYKSINILSASASIKTSLSAGSIVNIILVSIFVFISTVLDIILKGKTIWNTKSLLHYSLNTLMLIFTFVALVVLPKSTIVVKESGLLINGNALIILVGCLGIMGITENPTKAMTTYISYSSVIFILYLLLFIVLTIIFALILKNLQTKENVKENSILNIVLQISSFILSISYLIVTSIFLNITSTDTIGSLGEMNASIGSSSIVALIMSTFIIVISFILILNTPKQKNVDNN